MYAFVGYAGLVPAGGNLPGPPLKGYPLEKAQQNILREWQRMIQAAFNRDRICLGTVERSLIWFAPQNRFLEATTPPKYYEELAAQALANLLLKHGQLIKQCPAPRMRGKLGEKCENVFVASRPNKLYCSTACQSRTTTAQSRARPKGGRKKRSRKNQ